MESEEKKKEIIKILLLSNSILILALINLMFQQILEIFNLKIEDFEKWKTRRCIKESIMLKQDKDMVKEFRYGLMAQDTKDIGDMIRLMDKGGLFMQMEMFMWENGKMIRLVGMGSICI